MQIGREASQDAVNRVLGVLNETACTMRNQI